jgi:hypothetical protein
MRAEQLTVGPHSRTITDRLRVAQDLRLSLGARADAGRLGLPANAKPPVAVLESFGV